MSVTFQTESVQRQYDALRNTWQPSSSQHALELYRSSCAFGYWGCHHPIHRARLRHRALWLLSLAWIILGYFAILDLELGPATTKFVTEALGKGARDE